MKKNVLENFGSLLFGFGEVLTGVYKICCAVNNDMELSPGIEGICNIVNGTGHVYSAFTGNELPPFEGQIMSPQTAVPTIGQPQYPSYYSQTNPATVQKFGYVPIEEQIMYPQTAVPTIGQPQYPSYYPQTNPVTVQKFGYVPTPYDTKQIQMIIAAQSMPMITQYPMLSMSSVPVGYYSTHSELYHDL